MRTLCLNLHRNEKPSVAEQFLTFSPRVHYREPGLVFAEISTTSHLFGGESALLKEATGLARDFFPEATAAISNSPAVAQVFSSQETLHISDPAKEQEDLNELPLSSLSHLEGLVAWRSTREIEDIIDFFSSLGLNKIQQIRRFEVEAFRERWGDTGSLLWRRLHGLDRQVISPLTPSESLLEYAHLDYPVSLLSFLLHCLEKSLKSLLARLQGRGEFARKVQLHLYCEYSDKYHLIELVPANPGRDLKLILKLLENKLFDLDLDNPIREFEIEIIPCPEKTHQFDFWQPRVQDTDKLEQLVSLFNQASVTTGFFRPQDAIMPEDSWQLTSDFEAYEPLDHDLELEDLPEAARSSFQLRPVHSAALAYAPRPSLILKKPKRLSPQQVKSLHFLSQHPVERLEDGWWDSSRGRDYFFALTPKGESLWVFYDRIENEYFIHGYFD